MAAPTSSIFTRVAYGVSQLPWLGIWGTGWRCAGLPRLRDEAMERKRAGASIPMRRCQIAADFTQSPFVFVSERGGPFTTD